MCSGHSKANCISKTINERILTLKFNANSNSLGWMMINPKLGYSLSKINEL